MKRIFKILTFLILIFNVLSFIPIYAEETSNIEFPSGVKELVFRNNNEIDFNYLEKSYNFKYDEILKYKVIDLNNIEKTFKIQYEHIVNLIDHSGINPIGIDMTYKNSTTKRYPFNKNRNVTFGATRIIDIMDGRVLSILNENNVPLNITFVYIEDGESDESKYLITGGVAKIGYVSYLWDEYNSDYESAIFIISTPAGIFNCFQKETKSESEYWDSTLTYYSEYESGVKVFRNYTQIPSEYGAFLGLTGKRQEILHLIELEKGRLWDQVIIELNVDDARMNVDETPEITYTAHYEYNSHPFEGIVKIASPMSLDVGYFTYSVESIVDPQYGLVNFSCKNATIIWDRVKIIDGGVSAEETNVKSTEIVWFKAEYEYDFKSFEDSGGALYINEEPMYWSNTNKRWEKEYTFDNPESMTFKITGIRDDKYGLTSYDDAVGSLMIEWKQKGISGFPYLSVIIGIFLATFTIRWLASARV